MSSCDLFNDVPPLGWAAHRGATTDRGGSGALLETETLLDVTEQLLGDLEFSAELAWLQLGWMDAALAVAVSRTAPQLSSPMPDTHRLFTRARYLLGELEEHRMSLHMLETDAAFERRCAAALVALDAATVGFTPSAAQQHVPPFAAGDPQFEVWRAARTQGCTSPVHRPTYDTLVEQLEVSGGGSAVLVLLDWLSLLDRRDRCWVDDLTVAVFGRYGPLVRVENPADAVVVVPTLAARFVNVALMGRLSAVSSGPLFDPTSTMDAVTAALGCLTDPRWREAQLTSTADLAVTHFGSGVLHSTLR